MIVDQFRFCIQDHGRSAVSRVRLPLRHLICTRHSGLREVDPCLADLGRKFLLLIVLISMVKHVRDLRAVVRISIREYVSIDRGAVLVGFVCHDL